MIQLSKIQWLLALTLLLAGTAGGQELGRLFLTPAERAHLERLRILDNQPRPVLRVEPERENEPPPPPSTPPEEIIFAHGGLMERNDGSILVWLNNQPFSRDELPGNVELLSPAAQGRLRISNPETGQTFIVRPGQVLNLTRDQLLESYQLPASDSGATVNQDAAQ